MPSRAENLDVQVRELFEDHIQLNNLRRSARMVGIPVIPFNFFIAGWRNHAYPDEVIKTERYRLGWEKNLYDTMDTLSFTEGHKAEDSALWLPRPDGEDQEDGPLRRTRRKPRRRSARPLLPTLGRFQTPIQAIGRRLLTRPLVVDVETNSDRRRSGSSNSLCSLKFGTPGVGQDWWRWRSGWGVYEWLTVTAIGEKAEGIATLVSRDGHIEWARISSMRSGEGFKPVRKRDRDPVSLRSLFPRAAEQFQLGA